MRKLIYFFAVTLVMFAAVGCEKSADSTSSDQVDVITLSAEINNNRTKTALGEKEDDEYPVLWSIGDAIAVINNGNLFKFTVDPEDAGTTQCTLIMDETSLPAGCTPQDFDPQKAIQAVYPYQGVVYNTNTHKISYTVPAVQTYKTASFCSGSSPMSACSGNAEGIISFENLFGALKLQLKGVQRVKSISIQGKNDEKLSGAADITTFSVGIAPSLTITSTNDAAKSVTLNCGDIGVPLSESEATEFIIALPPVIFSNGFTVTVFDSESQEYRIEASVENTVLKSSLLTMPELVLDEKFKIIKVESISLSKTSLTMLPDVSYTLETVITPANATELTFTWSSSNPAVATVNQNGKITAIADGTATITVVATGGATAQCEVKVVAPTAKANKKYIADEIDYGYGIAIGSVVWAPVNCGYEAANGDYKGYPYGKLYQWSRKYGQGYDDKDATTPILVAGPVDPAVGNSKENADKFYTVKEDPLDWSSVYGNMWVDSNGEKTENDPCPDGWRVPTSSELESLKANSSSWTTDSKGQKGFYFSGEYTYIPGAPKVFLPAAGYRQSSGSAGYRNIEGNYWSSNAFYYEDSYYLVFSSNYYIGINNYYNSLGASVRCVQE